MTSQMTTQPAMADLARHLRFSSPFELNRISDIGLNALAHNVDAIHADEFEELQHLARRVRRSDALGVILLGEAGVGKSHLIARVANELRAEACITHLHNVQVRAERLPRYVLKSILSQLAREPRSGLHGGQLNELLAATVKNALSGTTNNTLSSVQKAYHANYVQPAINAGNTDQEFTYEVLFAYFVAVYKGQRRQDSNPKEAEYALRWLTGDTLDPEEISAMGLPSKVAKRITSLVPDDQGAEAVLSCIANLAAQANQTFIMFFDQVDNLSQDQIAVWAKFAHGLIDHIPNLLIVTSGVRGRILELQQSQTVNDASWDRIAQCRVDIGRITPEQASQLLKTRLTAFLEPFTTDARVAELIESDPLFPLGTTWLENRIGAALDLRPREVINWAQDRFQRLAKEVKSVGLDEWLANWKSNNQQQDLQPPECKLSESERLQLIDTKIEDKLVEQFQRRKLEPETLPADAENLLGLTEQLLAQCIEVDHDYSLEQFKRLDEDNRKTLSAYDLLVTEKSPDGQTHHTGVKFIGTGSKTSTAFALRRIVNVAEPPTHTLVVTEERSPLQLGPKGKEYLEQLQARGSDAFSVRELTFDSHVQMDALQALVGLAKSGDIEVTLPNGNSEPINADQVTEAHHRNDRYRKHDLLRELLTEEPATPSKQDSSVSVLESSESLNDQTQGIADSEVQEFVLGQVSLTNGVSTTELADKYAAQLGQNVDGNAELRQKIEQAVVALHQCGKVIATPQDVHTFVSLPTRSSNSETLSAASSACRPTHFTVTQVRQAAACPRLLHLDAQVTRTRKLKQPRVTRIWQSDDGSEVTALGSLFHQCVEKFNSTAHRSQKLIALLNSNPSVSKLSTTLESLISSKINKSRFAKATPAQKKNFHQALSTYSAELAQVLIAGMSRKSPTVHLLNEVFGDSRRQVDVTFHVGPDDRQVHVTGILDFVFYDWRRGSNRIIDYKLTPGKSVEADLFQICVYALMHHQQHGTKPDVGLLYLHPQRNMVEMSWHDVYERRHLIYDLLSSMVDWQEFGSESCSGLHPPGNPSYCEHCTYAKTCISKLGPPEKGQRLSNWTDAKNANDLSEPVVQCTESNATIDEAHVALDEPESLATSSETSVSTTETATTPEAISSPRDSAERESGLLLGKTESGNNVRLPLEMLPSHVAVVGAAGSGKTWMAKVIAEEAIRHEVPVIAIDPQGDLVQFLRPTASASPAYSTEFEQYTSHVEPRIYSPGSSHATRLSIDPLRLPSETELQCISNPSRRAEERDGMLSATISNLVNIAKAGGDVELQRTFLMRLTKQLITRTSDAAVSLSDLASSVMAPDSCGIEDPDDYIPKAQRMKLGRTLRALLEGPRAKLFKGGQSLDFDQFCRPTESGKTPLNVIYLNALSNDEEKQFFVATLATELYRWMVTSKSSNGKAKLLVYLDEAKDFAPAGTREPLAKSPLLRLFAQGRKFGVAGLICTQSPRSVDYNIFSNCSTKMIGRLESAQDVERVKEWFGNDGGAPPWLGGRKSAARGTFVGRWPEMLPMLEGQTFKGRPLFSLHEGAWTPDQVELAMDQIHES